MPEGRFYDDYVELNKKSGTKKAKKKITNRLVLVILIIITLVYLLVLNIQNRAIQKDEGPTVKIARSVEGFEEKTLEDGSKITVERITLSGNEGIAYIIKESTSGAKESLAISLSDINENADEITINDEGLNIKVNLKDKKIEEVKGEE